MYNSNRTLAVFVYPLNQSRQAARSPLPAAYFHLTAATLPCSVWSCADFPYPVPRRVPLLAQRWSPTGPNPSSFALLHWPHYCRREGAWEPFPVPGCAAQHESRLSILYLWKLIYHWGIQSSTAQDTKLVAEQESVETGVSSLHLGKPTHQEQLRGKQDAIFVCKCWFWLISKSGCVCPSWLCARHPCQAACCVLTPI